MFCNVSKGENIASSANLNFLQSIACSTGKVTSQTKTKKNKNYAHKHTKNNKR